MTKTVQYFEVAEIKGGFVYAYIKGFQTEDEARENINSRTSGNWIINKVEGYYRKNGMFKRSNTSQVTT